MKKLILLIAIFNVSLHVNAGICYRCYQHRATLAMQCFGNITYSMLYAKTCTKLLDQSRMLYLFHKRYDKLIKLVKKKIPKSKLRAIARELSNDPCDHCFSYVLHAANVLCVEGRTHIKTCQLAQYYSEIAFRNIIEVFPLTPTENS